jgi:hypothetical protein
MDLKKAINNIKKLKRLKISIKYKMIVRFYQTTIIFFISKK